MELSILSHFGLNANDTRIYEALLKLGRSKTGPLLIETGISSSSAYASLAMLVKNGLASYQVRNNIKYYQAELPEHLIEETKAQAQALERLTKEISSLPIAHTERNEVNVYQGIQGFKRAHEIMANEAKPGEEISATTFSTHYGKSKQIRKFYASLDRKLLLNKKCKIRIILDKDLKDIISSDRSSFVKKYEFRWLPREYFSPCGINISDSMVIIGVGGKNPIAFTMRNKTVIESFRTNFNFLWSKGRR